MIYSNGYVEVAEFDGNNGEWTQTIGRSDDTKDDMLYARTQKFYQYDYKNEYNDNKNWVSSSSKSSNYR